VGLGSNSHIAIFNPSLIPCLIGLDLISKVSSKEEGIQAYLYTRQPGNLNDVGLTTNYEQLQQIVQSY